MTIERGYRALAGRLRRVLPQSTISVDVWNPLHFHEIFRHSESGRASDLILTGGSLARILNTAHWPKGRYKLWVPCHAARNLICSVTGAQKTQIGVVPRNLLFTPSKLPRTFPSDKFSLVYGGRLTPMKGLWQLIEVASLLQCEHDLEIELILSGPWSESITHYFASEKMSSREVKQKTLQLIRRLPWKIPPKIVTNADPGDWFKIKTREPVFASFSESTHEDFGVSLAQAQEQGWPAVLSGWGAHRDAAAPNVIYVPKFSLFADERTRSRECRQLASFVAKKIRTSRKGPFPRSSKSVLKPPKLVTELELSKWQARAEKSYPGILKAAKTGFADYGETPAGKRLIDAYMRAFAQPRSKKA